MKPLFLDRNLSETLKEAYRYFPVITLTGPRQSGKTTLLRNIFKDLEYYSLENLDVRHFALNDPKAFLAQSKAGMLLDEVQHTPELLSYIQGIVDENPEKRFVLSGSSQFSVLKDITQSLAGRTAIFELLPFSYSEIKEKARHKTLDTLLFDGFYPAIYAEKNIPTLFYPAYTKTYLERDVRNLLQIKDMMQFQTFLKLCAGRIGSLFNANQLANEIGVSSHTIKSWLSILQASYIIHLLPPYYENSSKRLIKSPKLYFCDTGLACYLLDIENEKQLQRDKMRGNLFENFIVTEVLKRRYNQGKSSNIYFYRDSNQNEIDLLIKNGRDFTAIEIKSSQTYHTDFEKSLQKTNTLIHSNIVKKGIVYAGDFENTEGDIQLLNYRHLHKMLSD